MWQPDWEGSLEKNAAAAAKSLQSCPTLCDPIDGSPPSFPVPGILQARTLQWVAISFSNAWKWKVKVKSLSRVRLLATPWTAAYKAPPSMEFSRHVNVQLSPFPVHLKLSLHCLLISYALVQKKKLGKKKEKEIADITATIEVRNSLYSPPFHLRYWPSPLWLLSMAMRTSFFHVLECWHMWTGWEALPWNQTCYPLQNHPAHSLSLALLLVCTCVYRSCINTSLLCSTSFGGASHWCLLGEEGETFQR